MHIKKWRNYTPPKFSSREERRLNDARGFLVLRGSPLLRGGAGEGVEFNADARARENCCDAPLRLSDRKALGDKRMEKARSP